MAKRYKLSLENIAEAVEQCPFVACKGPYGEDYEIMPSQKFVDWADEHAGYSLKVYRRPNEAFFRVDVMVPNQKVVYSADVYVEFALFLVALAALGVFAWTILF